MKVDVGRKWGRGRRKEGRGEKGEERRRKGGTVSQYPKNSHAQLLTTH